MQLGHDRVAIGDNSILDALQFGKPAKVIRVRFHDHAIAAAPLDVTERADPDRLAVVGIPIDVGRVLEHVFRNDRRVGAGASEERHDEGRIRLGHTKDDRVLVGFVDLRDLIPAVAPDHVGLRIEDHLGRKDHVVGVEGRAV